MKFLLFSLIPILMILTTSAAYGDSILEEKTIVGLGDNLGDESILYLEFANTVNDMPQLNDGYVGIFDDRIELTNASLRYYGDSSFVIKQFENNSNLVIFGYSNNNQNYDITAYLFSSGNVLKLNFDGMIQDTTVDDSDSSDASADSDSSETPIDMIMLVQHDLRNFWKEDFGVSIKVFDSALNPKPTFDRSNGSIENVNVNIVVTHDGESTPFADLERATDEKGAISELIFIPDQTLNGKYDIIITASYKGNILEQNYEMFILGEPER